MASPDIRSQLGEMVAYTQQQDRERELLLRRGAGADELSSFAVTSIHRLAVVRFEPVVHAICQDVPESTDEELREQLSNPRADVMATPSFGQPLPVRYSRSLAAAHSDTLMLPTGGGILKRGILKISTAAREVQFDELHIMRIATFRGATRKELREFRQARAAIGDVVAQDASIIVPRRAVEYESWQYRGEDHYSCLYRGRPSGWRSDKDITVHSPNTDPEREPAPGPGVRAWNLSTLHEKFMEETRVAVRGLAVHLR